MKSREERVFAAKLLDEAELNETQYFEAQGSDGSINEDEPPFELMQEINTSVKRQQAMQQSKRPMSQRLSEDVQPTKLGQSTRILKT